ncbi:lysocardiolipin and lysophospholipid acyltransferase [Enteropsectra breve]|nr:lysocardiolipin and lysophospholipid acyltransferase [Enteropsectra breve]
MGLAKYPKVRTAYKIFLFLLFLIFTIIVGPIFCIACGITRIFSTRVSIQMATATSFVSWTLFNKIYSLSVKINRPAIPKGNYLVLMNHLSSTDFMLANHLNIHNFKDNKYCMKPLWYFPIFYQMVQLMNFLSVRRGYEKDKKSIQYFIDTAKKAGLPMWIVFFPEGHRFTESFQKESQEFCKSRKIVPFKHLLYPRFKGFKLLVDALQKPENTGLINKILDVTFDYKKVPTFFSVIFTSKVYVVDCDIRTIDISEIQNSDDSLIDIFRRKDLLIEKWKNN